MQYKINLHAHTIFSDGCNTPYVMAQKAKELGFSALVITDHYYINNDFSEFSLNEDRWCLLRQACKEAREIIPIIIGIEASFMNQEVLIFGGEAIKRIFENKSLTPDEMLTLRKETHCAVILCHPGGEIDALEPYIDGFEHYNSGQNWFSDRGFGKLKNKPRWCNSDAHGVKCLDWGYNIVTHKIQNESDLIKYIKSGKQPEFYTKNKD